MCRESDLFMKIKTAELAGKALDFTVALIEGATYSRDFDEPVIEWTEKFDTPLRNYSPSTDWTQGGPVLGREIHNLFKWNQLVKGPELWCAVHYAKTNEGTQILRMDGPTPLIAAMRCLVKATLGDEVEVPDELL